MYIRSPPPLLFLSNLNGALKLSILNWAEGNESSSFVSKIKIISIFLPIVFSKESVVFLIELVLSDPRLICQLKGF